MERIWKLLAIVWFLHRLTYEVELPCKLDRFKVIHNSHFWRWKKTLCSLLIFFCFLCKRNCVGSLEVLSKALASKERRNFSFFSNLRVGGSHLVVARVRVLGGLGIKYVEKVHAKHLNPYTISLAQEHKFSNLYLCAYCILHYFYIMKKIFIIL